jgi:hypothetical protein
MTEPTAHELAVEQLSVEELRERYQLSEDGLDFKRVAEERGLVFDAWLAEHDRQVEAAALEDYASALEENRSATSWSKDDFVADIREWRSYNILGEYGVSDDESEETGGRLPLTNPQLALRDLTDENVIADIRAKARAGAKASLARSRRAKTSS